LLLVGATILHVSCTPGHEQPTAAQVSPPPAVHSPAAPEAAVPSDTVNIVTNTQARVGEVQIGAGNFWDGEYEGTDGNKQTGRSAGLWISISGDPSAHRTLRVGAGTKFTADRYAFEVLEVTDDTVRIRYSSQP
jgi:hypothetical protein